MAKLYWVTGYSGAGKTTIGRELHKIVKRDDEASVLLDGDEMRKIFGDDLGYTKEDRFKSAMRYAKLCEFLTHQGINVICCTISMFDEVRNWNRNHIKNYTEVYIKVSKEILFQRNQKDLYSGYKQGVASNVAGLDLLLDEPQNPDIVIENDGSISPPEAAEMIYKGESYHVK